MNSNKEQTCIRALADENQISRCKKKIENVGSDLSDVATIIGLIGNDTRIKTLYLIQSEDRLCVCDLSDILGMTVPAVSQQLRKLKDRGIISSERDGTIIYYSLKEEYVELFSNVLNHSSNRILIKA
ncbi:MAG: helix-turn-helix transcriptional regulator [Cyclobacteriaceae bacterium]|nr:helix-turn-helix transcriptional regulator [Cyclobacteriaceae bacterium]